MKVAISVDIPSDKYVRVGDNNVRYWELGKEGKTLILLHGLYGFAESWAKNISSLARHHRVYVLDFVGFGHSDKPIAPYSVPYLTQFIREFMAIQGIKQATIVGNSMGGGVALQFALNFPNQIDGLVLVDSAGLGREVAMSLRLAFMPLLGRYITNVSRRGSTQISRQIVFKSELATNEWIQLALEMYSLPGAQRSLLTTGRSMFNMQGQKNEFINPILSSLSRINAPTLIIWGKQDRIIPVSHAFATIRKMPNARLHIINRCGHIPQFECPTEFNDVVLEFLEEGRELWDMQLLRTTQTASINTM